MKSGKDSAGLSARMRQEFATLMAGASAWEVSKLLEYEKILSKIYMVDATSKSSYTVSARQIPWTTAFTLGAYSMKHIFIRKEAPALRVVGAGINGALQKFRWAYVHRLEAGERKRCLDRGLPTPPCREPMPPEISAICSHIHHGIMQHL